MSDVLCLVAKTGGQAQTLWPRTDSRGAGFLTYGAHAFVQALNSYECGFSSYASRRPFTPARVGLRSPPATYANSETTPPNAMMTPMDSSSKYATS